MGGPQIVSGNMTRDVSCRFWIFAQSGALLLQEASGRRRPRLQRGVFSDSTIQEFAPPCAYRGGSP